MKPKTPRVNKTKEQLIQEIKQSQYVAKQVAITKLLFPLLEDLEKIYDAQTTLNAVAGYIEYGLKLKQDELKVGNLGITMSEEPESKIKTAALSVLGLIELESAYDMMQTLRKVSDHMGQFGASQFVKGPMANLKVTDIVK